MNLVGTYTWTLSESEPKANDEVSDHGIIIAQCAIQADFRRKTDIMRKLILASASPRRRELLSQAGIEYQVCASDREERSSERKPEQLVMDLAGQKAADVYEKLGSDKEQWILGADTVVSLDGEIFGKPSDEEDAFRMLKRLQGRTHQVFTGVCLKMGEVTRVFCERTDVTMYELSDGQIRDYIQTGEPMDKAGAYGIQGKGAVLVRSVRGDYNNVVGLPLARVWQELAAHSDLSLSRGRAGKDGAVSGAFPGPER